MPKDMSKTATTFSWIGGIGLVIYFGGILVVLGMSLVPSPTVTESGKALEFNDKIYIEAEQEDLAIFDGKLIKIEVVD